MPNYIDKDGNIIPLFFKGQQGDKGEKGDKGEDGNVLQQEAIDKLNNNTITVSVKNFGAKGDSVTNDSLCIQNAINNIGSKGGGIIVFPQGTYCIDEPIIIDYPNITLEGVGNNTILKKISNKNSGNVRTVNGVPITYNLPSIINILFPNDSYRVKTKITKMLLIGDDTTNTTLIHCPRVAHTQFENLQFEKSECAIRTNTAWMVSYKDIRSRFSNTHFVVEGGTSNNFSNVHVDQRRDSSNSTGYLIDNVQYTTFESCGADGVNIGYRIINNSSVSLNGTGCETYDKCINVNNSTVSINGGELEFHAIDSGISLQRYPWVFENNAIVTANGVKFTLNDFTTNGNVQDWTKVQGITSQSGAQVLLSNCNLSYFEAKGINPIVVSGDTSSIKNITAKGEETYTALYKPKTNQTTKQTSTKTVNMVNGKNELFRFKSATYGSSIFGSFKVMGYAPPIQGVTISANYGFSCISRNPKKEVVITEDFLTIGQTSDYTKPTLVITGEFDVDDIVIYGTYTTVATSQTVNCEIEVTYKSYLDKTEKLINMI